MKIYFQEMKKPIDILARYQKLILAIAIFLALSAASFGYIDGEFRLGLGDYPQLIVLLVLAAVLMAIIYIRIDQSRIKKLSEEIKVQSTDKNDDFDSLLSELTSRQNEVYELIVAGKSNKEIMAELYIEQSTLKSHINQIYKKLNIKSRRELKSKLR